MLLYLEVLPGQVGDAIVKLFKKLKCINIYKWVIGASISVLNNWVYMIIYAVDLKQSLNGLISVHMMSRFLRQSLFYIKKLISIEKNKAACYVIKRATCRTDRAHKHKLVLQIKWVESKALR